MSTRRRLLGDESGQSIVTVGFLSLFILMILGMVLDVGWFYMNRRDLQKTADAAALAGAQALDGTAAGYAQAQIDAQTWADKNITGLTSFTTVAITDNSGRIVGIRVTVHKNSDGLLGSFSWGTKDVGAKAAAMIRSPQIPGPGAFPTGMSTDTWNYVKDRFGQLVILKEPGGGSVNSGNYGYLDFGSGGNTTCQSALSGSPIPVTDPQLSESGAKNNLKNCISARMVAAKDSRTTPYGTNYSCWTLDSDSSTGVLDSDGKVNDRCNPLIGATKGTDPKNLDAQPTAVVLLPGIQYVCSGKCFVPLISGSDGERLFTFFFLDQINVTKVTKTVLDPATKALTTVTGPTCSGGQCSLVGAFLQPHSAPLVPPGGDVGDFDPNSVEKVVQLTE